VTVLLADHVMALLRALAGGRNRVRGAFSLFAEGGLLLEGAS
jgi:hypothetical protein